MTEVVTVTATNATESRDDKRTYGIGTIYFVAETGRWRFRVRRHGEDRSLFFESYDEAVSTRQAFIELDRGEVGGITLRQWGEIWFSEYDFSDSILHTWRSVVCGAAFIDAPLRTLDSGEIAGWASDLLERPATRSVLRDGKRTLEILDHPISRSYAKQGLSILRSALNAAKNRKPQIIKTNPAADVEVPKAKVGGKIRTKRAKRTSKLDYLEQGDCSRIFYCEHCEAATGVPRTNLEQLVACPHCPFMYRTALSCSIVQGLRQGEIASQRWERIMWSGASDWTGCFWLVETSWNDDCKNGQDRTQALIPMAARLLARWRQLKGSPSAGLLFSAGDAAPKRALGPAALFVAAHPHLANRDLLRAAQHASVPITLRQIEVLRSEARKRADRKRSQADKMFARGYDFGWADTPFRDADGVLQVKPGWVSKLELSNRTRFHDHRDTAATHLLSGSWGPAWDIKMVSEFLGHSDVKVTQDRYAHLTNDAKLRAAAQINPGAPKIGQTLANSSRNPTDLSACYHSAPEVGLEPTTTRLTVNSIQSDSAHLGQNVANVWPLQNPAVHKLAKQVLEAAMGGAPVKAAALALAGAVLEATDADETEAA